MTIILFSAILSQIESHAALFNNLNLDDANLKVKSLFGVMLCQQIHIGATRLSCTEMSSVSQVGV